ncbi:MAG: ankyrin repeat domain-containing protein [Pseudomonadota bacterium]
MNKFKICIFSIILLITFSSFAKVYAAKQEYSLDEELLYRINFGRTEDVKVLLDSGANPNALSKTGEYALTVAIGRDDSEAVSIVKTLLDKGANPNVYDKSNSYPIVSAVLNNKTEMVSYLLAKNADFHVKSINGRSLLDIAKANDNKEIIKMIQEAFDKEAAFAASLHTPERFKSIITKYVFDSCAYQYWNFVKGSRQMEDKSSEIDDQIQHVRLDIANMIEQIQKYYPTTPSGDLQRIANDASQKIFDILDAMISNNNRRQNGVGTDADLNKRCQKIVDSINIEFPPSVYK